MPFDPTSLDWGTVSKQWLQILAVLGGVGLLLALIISIGNHGVGRGFNRLLTELVRSVEEIATVSPRRVWALAMLTFKEAVRRKALLVFVVFAMLFMFAGWFLSDTEQRTNLQIKVYVSFVLTAITWLTIPVVLLLSCWGLPEDIRLRSLHTVVTKPARRLEIVLGRILGFSSIGLLVLSVMGVVGYIWVDRQVPSEHDHLLKCRVPVHGELSFLDNQGRPATEGINTGDVWMFRSYIMGSSRARAIYTFSGLTPDVVGETLQLESRFESFRSHKGRDMSRGLICQMTLTNDLRDAVFRGLTSSEHLNPAAEFLLQGQYQNAADELAVVATSLEVGETSIGPAQLRDMQVYLKESIVALDDLELDDSNAEWRDSLSDAFNNVDRAAGGVLAAAAASGEPDFSRLASELRALVDTIRADSDAYREHLVSRAVSLPPFEVREFREGENLTQVERQVKYEAGLDDIARHLGNVVTEANQSGELVSDNTINSAAIDKLVAAGSIAEEHGRSLQTALSELIEADSLRIEGSKLVGADQRTLYGLVDELVRSGRISTNEAFELQADLFKDLTNNGQLVVKVACHSSGQYLGMARPDLFVRLPDREFSSGFLKAIIAIGLMLILVVALGVAASCFVKGPVATLLTLCLVIIGLSGHGFLERVASGEKGSDGFGQSVYRMSQHINTTSPLEADESVLSLIAIADRMSTGFLWLIKHVIPDFKYFSESTQYVENGFDVPWSTCLVPCLMTTLAFLIPCLLIGFLTLKYRELEAK